MFRIEPLLERLADGAAPLAGVLDAFEDGIRMAITPDGYVAYKSVIAYRSGLAVERRDTAVAAAALERHRRGDVDALGPLRDLLFVRTLEVARELDVAAARPHRHSATTTSA